MALMQVSRKVDYALRAAIHLARQPRGQATSVSEISAVEGIPKKFLEKILQDLIHAKIVGSRRGAHGGYFMVRSSEDVSFREVMEAVEGPLALNVCVGSPEACSVSNSCGMQHIWSEGQRLLLDYFTTTKLSNLTGPRSLTSASFESAESVHL